MFNAKKSYLNNYRNSIGPRSRIFSSDSDRFASSSAKNAKKTDLIDWVAVKKMKTDSLWRIGGRLDVVG